MATNPPPPPAPIPTVTTIKEVIDALQSIIDWSISVSSRLCYFPALHVQAAVVVTPVIWFQTVKRSAISWRHPVADSRCRRGRKCGEMRLNADRNRCACGGEVNRSSPARVAGPVDASSRPGCSDTSIAGVAPRTSPRGGRPRSWRAFR